MSSVWGIDWSTKDVAIGVWPSLDSAVALSRTDVGEPARLMSLFAKTRGLALVMLERHGPPFAVYVEQAIGKPNPWLMRADGVVQAGLWSAIGQATPHPISVWPYRTTEWRQKLALGPPPKAERQLMSKVEQRQWRKAQQRAFAVELGCHEGLPEAEYDAVCIAAAGARDCNLAAAA